MLFKNSLIKEAKIPFLYSPLFMLSRAEEHHNIFHYFMTFDVLIYFFTCLIFIFVGVYLWSVEKSSSINKKIDTEQNTFWLVLVTVMRMNLIPIKTAAGKLIIAILILVAFILHKMYISSLISFNRHQKYSSKFFF